MNPAQTFSINIMNSDVSDEESDKQFLFQLDKRRTRSHHYNADEDTDMDAMSLRTDDDNITPSPLKQTTPSSAPVRMEKHHRNSRNKERLRRSTLNSSKALLPLDDGDESDRIRPVRRSRSSSDDVISPNKSGRVRRGGTRPPSKSKSYSDDSSPSKSSRRRLPKQSPRVVSKNAPRMRKDATSPPPPPMPQLNQSKSEVGSLHLGRRKGDEEEEDDDSSPQFLPIPKLNKCKSESLPIPKLAQNKSDSLPIPKLGQNKSWDQSHSDMSLNDNSLVEGSISSSHTRGTKKTNPPTSNTERSSHSRSRQNVSSHTRRLNDNNNNEMSNHRRARSVSRHNRRSSSLSPDNTTTPSVTTNYSSKTTTTTETSPRLSKPNLMKSQSDATNGGRHTNTAMRKDDEKDGGALPMPRLSRNQSHTVGRLERALSKMEVSSTHKSSANVGSIHSTRATRNNASNGETTSSHNRSMRPNTPSHSSKRSSSVSHHRRTRSTSGTVRSSSVSRSPERATERPASSSSKKDDTSPPPPTPPTSKQNMMETRKNNNDEDSVDPRSKFAQTKLDAFLNSDAEGTSLSENKIANDADESNYTPRGPTKQRLSISSYKRTPSMSSNRFMRSSSLSRSAPIRTEGPPVTIRDTSLPPLLTRSRRTQSESDRYSGHMEIKRDDASSSPPPPPPPPLSASKVDETSSKSNTFTRLARALSSMEGFSTNSDHDVAEGSKATNPNLAEESSHSTNQNTSSHNKTSKGTSPSNSRKSRSLSRSPSRSPDNGSERRRHKSRERSPSRSPDREGPINGSERRRHKSRERSTSRNGRNHDNTEQRRTGRTRRNRRKDSQSPDKYTSSPSKGGVKKEHRRRTGRSLEKRSRKDSNSSSNNNNNKSNEKDQRRVAKGKDILEDAKQHRTPTRKSFNNHNNRGRESIRRRMSSRIIVLTDSSDVESSTQDTTDTSTQNSSARLDELTIFKRMDHDRRKSDNTNNPYYSATTPTNDEEETTEDEERSGEKKKKKYNFSNLRQAGKMIWNHHGSHYIMNDDSESDISIS